MLLENSFLDRGINQGALTLVQSAERQFVFLGLQHPDQEFVAERLQTVLIPLLDALQAGRKFLENNGEDLALSDPQLNKNDSMKMDTAVELIIANQLLADDPESVVKTEERQNIGDPEVMRLANYREYHLDPYDGSTKTKSAIESFPELSFLEAIKAYFAGYPDLAHPSSAVTRIDVEGEVGTISANLIVDHVTGAYYYASRRIHQICSIPWWI